MYTFYGQFVQCSKTGLKTRVSGNVQTTELSLSRTRHFVNVDALKLTAMAAI